MHRNTIGRQLKKIRQRLLKCPIRNVTTPVQLSPGQTAELGRMAQAGNTNPRGAFRARLILALAERLSYAQIVLRLGATRPTIARWKLRFQTQGIDGIKARNAGRKPQVGRRKRLLAWLENNARTGKEGLQLSCRKIAKALGMGKSTVHRILRADKSSHS